VEEAVSLRTTHGARKVRPPGDRRAPAAAECSARVSSCRGYGPVEGTARCEQSGGRAQRRSGTQFCMYR
jgi:hypothetical protein